MCVEKLGWIVGEDGRGYFIDVDIPKSYNIIKERPWNSSTLPGGLRMKDFVKSV